jgi:hypothetical protein
MTDLLTLNIRLGNEAMQTPEDVAGALRDAATLVELYGISSVLRHVSDGNGNTVGSFEFVPFTIAKEEL